MFKDKQDFIAELKNTAIVTLGKDYEVCTIHEKYFALASVLAAKAKEIRNDSQMNAIGENKKRVYYFSMEFLIGKLLENYLIYFGIRDLVSDGLNELGDDLESLLLQETDPGLGNGGLGRLAACFIDSLASLGFIGNGNGIRYRYGLFRQEIEEGKQVEKPDNWLAKGYPWEMRHPENSVVVRFGGAVEREYDGQNMHYHWTGGDKIVAVPYDVPVVGYGGHVVNNLRLWSAEPYEENFDMDAFNRGDYSGAMKFRSDVEAISSILYPNDNSDAGRILRLKQEYMFVAAGVKSIVEEFKEAYGKDWKRFSQLVAIQTNDTHPALCGPELMRILVDDEGLSWDEAWDITQNTISYTNHTILPEALEKWPIDLVRSLLPRVYDFIEEIDRRYRESFPKNIDKWQELLKNTAILWDGQVRMANLSVICGHSVNGVAMLHTNILKASVLKDFYILNPEKFNNKTNGVSHRRFLIEANPSYASLITEAIGNDWMEHPDELEKLIAFEDDALFIKKAAESKKANKIRLAQYIKETTGVIIDTDSIFDIQVKRFHAYKRQLLNIFKVMDLYNCILEDPDYKVLPSTFIFAGKAAQGYEFAKDCIRLVNSVAYVINNDKRVRDRLKVAFVPNFSVSNGQLIYPAADISEQISTAGLEASGTGNMKFMMNGALTLGTLDGSTVEIAERVGNENIAIFGLRAEEIEKIKLEGSYYAWDEYTKHSRIKKVVDQLIDGTYAGLSGNFNGIYDAVLRNNDQFFVLRDFSNYIDTWHNLEKRYNDKEKWGKQSLHNTACSGFFSSDRAIKEYAKDIWKL